MQHGPSGPERAGMVPELLLSGDISCTHGTEYVKIARMKKIVFFAYFDGGPGAAVFCKGCDPLRG